MKNLYRLLPSVIIAAALIVSSYILYMGCNKIANDLYEIRFVANAIEELDDSSHFPTEIDVTLHPNTAGNVFPVAVSGSVYTD